MSWQKIRALALALGLAAGVGGSVVAATAMVSAASAPPAATSQAVPAPGGPMPGGAWGRGPGGPGFGRPGIGGPGARGIVGTIASVGGNGLTLTGRGQTYTVDLGATTAYDFAPDLAASQSDLATGEHVAVAGSTSGQTVTATTVYIQLPAYQGTVTAVNGGTLTIRQPSGRTGTLDVSGTPGVTVGQQVQGFGTWQGDTLTAKAWRVLPDRAGGTVASVSGDSTQVTEPDGSTVTVTWTSSTMFGAGPSRSASASAVVTGAHIQAEGQLSGGVLTATHIEILPAPPAPPAAPGTGA